MFKYSLSLFFALITLSFCHRGSSPERILARSKAHFQKNCASCHGADIGTFVQKKWAHGNSRLELIRSIRDGVPQVSGHQFSDKLSEKQILFLADYLLQNMTEQKEKILEKSAPADHRYGSEGITITLDTVLTDLENPWGMVFLPNNDLLFSERSGKLWRMDKARTKHEIKGVPPALVESQGGLLDIELHPKFDQTQWIYLTYSKFRDSLESTYSTTAVYRARLVGDTLLDGRDIFVAEPYTKTRYHYGSRMEFDREGHLFVSVGDRGMQDSFPQFLEKYPGKIHRIQDDGSIPKDNPFKDKPGAVASVWSYGHRNPQGLALHPVTGELWETEHGPKGGDEINIIRKGANHGWPLVSYGTHYDGRSFTENTQKDGITGPLDYWVPSIAPCGLLFVNSDLYPAWKGDLLAGSLRFKYLDRIDLKDGQLIKHEHLLPQIGRLRCISMDRNGFIYIAVEEPGIIYRLKPAGVR